MNAIRTIHPYMDHGVLVFDDPACGLVREPFIAGADKILIAAAVASGHHPQEGFPLHFSDTSMPGAMEAVRMDDRPVESGAWYKAGALEGWLCPATLQYFADYPPKIFFLIPQKNRNKEKP